MKKLKTILNFRILKLPDRTFLELKDLILVAIVLTLFVYLNTRK